MVAVAHLASRQGLELHVVFDVGRCDHHHRWFCELKDHALECTQARNIDVFDHFDRACRIALGESGVAISERALKQFDFLTLHLRHSVELKPLGCNLERAHRDVDPSDFGDRFVFQESGDELSFPTAEIQYAFGADLLQYREDRADALIVE